MIIIYILSRAYLIILSYKPKKHPKKHYWPNGLMAQLIVNELIIRHLDFVLKNQEK